MADKVVVTNRAALKRKYGEQGWTRIRAALDALKSADLQRGLETQLVLLDDAAQMKALSAPRVATAGNARQNKRAVDGVYRALAPDYLVLLGSVDVIPHQPLRNPMPGDGDDYAYGDIPYACEAPYSQDASRFVGPSRVVGRLPDLTGATDPAHLLSLLATAARWRSLDDDEYKPYFGLTAKVWTGSTRLSLRRVFGNSADMQSIPPRGPSWASTLLQRRSHFINCHGAASSPRFYGQEGDRYPVALDAAALPGKVREGTVVAAECCYGAELYDPAAAQGRMGICSAYLAAKAHAFFGSSTIAYGPADSNDNADLLCQFFLRRVVTGASVGRAALEARQQFAQQTGELSPADLKTLAQFNLLGDPSVTPVSTAAPPPHSAPKAAPGPAGGGAMVKARPAAAASDEGASRTERRRALLAKGLAIASTLPTAAGVPKGKPKAAVAAVLSAMAGDLGLRQVKTFTSPVRAPAGASPKAFGLLSAAAPKLQPASAFHVLLGTPPGSGKDAPLQPIVALVAKEVAGTIVSVRRLESR